MGFHKWGYPTWTVYNGKSRLNGWFSGTPISGNPHIFLSEQTRLTQHHMARFTWNATTATSISAVIHGYIFWSSHFKSYKIDVFNGFHMFPRTSQDCLLRKPPGKPCLVSVSVIGLRNLALPDGSSFTEGEPVLEVQVPSAPWHMGGSAWFCKFWAPGKKHSKSQGLVGGLVAINFIFPYIGVLIIPIDFHIFQRGSNHQPEECWVKQHLRLVIGEGLIDMVVHWNHHFCWWNERGGMSSGSHMNIELINSPANGEMLWDADVW